MDRPPYISVLNGTDIDDDTMTSHIASCIANPKNEVPHFGLGNYQTKFSFASPMATIAVASSGLTPNQKKSLFRISDYMLFTRLGAEPRELVTSCNFSRQVCLKKFPYIFVF